MTPVDRCLPFWFVGATLAVPVLAFPGSVDPFEMPRWFLIALLPALAVVIGRAGRLLRPAARTPVHFLLVYLGVFSLVHFLLAPSVVAAARGLVIVSLWGLFNAFQSVRGDLRAGALRWLAGLGAFEAGYGLLQYAGWDPLFVRAPWAEGPRMAMAGTIGTPTVYGLFMGLAFLAGVEVLLRARRKAWPGAALGLMAAALLLNNTRSAVTGTVLGLVVMAAGRLGRKIWVGLAAALLAAFFVVAAVPDLRARWVELADFRGTHSATIRGFYWKVTWAAITEKPLLGHGPGSFSRVYFDTQAELISSGRVEPPKVNQPMLWAHNDYLQVWLEYGLPGAVLLILALGWGLRRRPGEGPSAARGAAGLAAAAALVLFPFFHPSTLVPILWMLSGGAEAPPEGNAAQEG